MAKKEKPMIKLSDLLAESKSPRGGKSSGQILFGTMPETKANKERK
ncbi:MAG: hypothetical protein MK193_09745 [Lentisphaeria bacterium]|nr:hypothetical protein [Lentisphaeria bacterium]